MKIQFKNFTVERACDEILRLGNTYYKDLDNFKNWSVEQFFRFIADDIQYIKDPTGIELICRPAITLIRRAGDCDDKTVLMVSFLKLKNIQHGISVVGSDNHFSHVFPFMIIEGKKIDLDATYSGAVYGSYKKWVLRRDIMNMVTLEGYDTLDGWGKKLKSKVKKGVKSVKKKTKKVSSSAVNKGLKVGSSISNQAIKQSKKITKKVPVIAKKVSSTVVQVSKVPISVGKEISSVAQTLSEHPVLGPVLRNTPIANNALNAIVEANTALDRINDIKDGIKKAKKNGQLPNGILVDSGINVQDHIKKVTQQINELDEFTNRDDLNDEDLGVITGIMDKLYEKREELMNVASPGVMMYRAGLIT